MSNHSQPSLQPPVANLRLGNLELSIWANESNGRTFHSSKVVRTYRLPEADRADGDNGYRETSSLREEDLVLLQELAKRALAWLRQQE